MWCVLVSDKGTLSQLSYPSKGFTSSLIMNHKLGPYRSTTASGAQQPEYLLHNLALKQCKARVSTQPQSAVSDGLRGYCSGLEAVFNDYISFLFFNGIMMSKMYSRGSKAVFTEVNLTHTHTHTLTQMPWTGCHIRAILSLNKVSNYNSIHYFTLITSIKTYS